jgi:hypothetical protein
MASISQAAGFSDDFNTYSDGPLDGQGAWVGGTAGRVEVDAGRVELMASAGAENAAVTFNPPLSPDGSGIFEVSIDIMQDVPTGSSGSNFWGFWVNEPGGQNLGRWYQASYNPRPRIGGSGLVLNPADLPGDGQFHNLKMIINTVAHTTEFLFDGGSLGVLDHSSVTTATEIGTVYFEHWDRADAAPAHLYFDNLVVTPEPAALAGLMLGLLVCRRRRAA